MRSVLTRRPLPLPADVLEQLQEIQARQQREVTDTTYIPAQTPVDWLSKMIERRPR